MKEKSGGVAFVEDVPVNSRSAFLFYFFFVSPDRAVSKLATGPRRMVLNNITFLNITCVANYCYLYDI